MSRVAVIVCLVSIAGLCAWVAPANAYSACNLTSLNAAVVGRCGTDRVHLTGGSTSFGRVGPASAFISYTGSSAFGRIGEARFFYSRSGSIWFGRYGGLRVVMVLSGKTILGRVGIGRVNCLAAGRWYFCRGTRVEALIPIAALLVPSLG
jgi:hypothetical protein